MPVRIVAMADTHLFHRELSVPDGDVLIHAGDLCRGGHLRELAIALDKAFGVKIRAEDEGTRAIFRSVATLAAFVAENR